jgi:hypothetical protein
MHKETGIMGDFEDVFGEGADVEAIIYNVDRRNSEGEPDDEDWRYTYDSGQSVARVPRFAELTGGVGSLPPKVFETLDRRKRELLGEEARTVGYYLVQSQPGLCRTLRPAEKLSGHLISAISRCCQTIAEREAFLIMVTYQLELDAAVLIRDTRDQGTHAIMFPQGFYLTCPGRPDMQGWFNEDAFREWFPPTNGLPGHEILAISAALSGKQYLTTDWETVIQTYSEYAKAWSEEHGVGNDDDEDEDKYPYRSMRQYFREASRSLPPKVFETLETGKRKRFENVAEKLAEAHVRARWRKCGSAEVAAQCGSAIRRYCQTPAEREAFLILLTCSLLAEAVLIRDTKGAHAIMFQQEFYLFGEPDLSAPFWFTKEAFGSSPVNGLPGHEVLAVSHGVSRQYLMTDWDGVMLTYSEHAKTWVEECRKLSEKGEASPFRHVGPNQFKTFRTWSDLQEVNLRRLIQQLAAAILPLQTSCYICLHAEETESWIYASLADDRVSEPRAAAFKAALKLFIDLSPFRGRRDSGKGGVIIRIVGREYEPKCIDAQGIEDILKGREVLLDLAEQKRFDRAAVQTAIVREDWNKLAILFHSDSVD